MAFRFWKRTPTNDTLSFKELKQSNSTESFGAFAKSITRKKEVLPQRENFEYPNICLWEIKRAVATDSYISESLNKYKEKIFKAGYQLRGDEEKVDYINKRFGLMSFMGDVIIDILFQEIADDLITYHNAFLLKNRTDNIPFVKAVGFSSDLPVGGYTRLDPCSIIVVKDKYGNILRYELEEGYGENQKIAKEDLIHFYLDRKASENYGTPRLEPVLEDVKALREIEGNVLTLIHRFCFPLYHVTVGLPQNGYTGTQTDIDNIKREIETMNEDGMLITNEKVAVKVIGAESNALDLMNYLKYFENRVFSGINTSETQMGRDNNSSPDTMEAQIHDSVKHIERIFSLFLENCIINELLLEGGYNPILNKEDQVKFVFNEISLDTKVKLENHEMLKYQSNVQSLDETRQTMGRVESPSKEDFYVENVTNQSALIQIEAKNEGAIELATKQAQLAPKPTATGSTASGGQKKNNQGNGKVTTKQTKDVTTRNRPTNQHGTYSVKIREQLASVSKNSKKEEEIYTKCYKLYDLMRNDILEKHDKTSFLVSKEKIKTQTYELLDIKFELARSYYVSLTHTDAANTPTENNILDLDFRKKIDLAIDSLIDELEKEWQLGNNRFETWEYRLKFILNYWAQKYFWYSFAKIAKINGIDKLYVHFNRDDEKEKYEEVIDLNHFSIDSLPPFHPYCKCELQFYKKGDS